MTGVTCALAGGGKSIYTGSAIVTVGELDQGTLFSYGFVGGSIGSIAPTTWASTGLTVSSLYGDTDNNLVFTVNALTPNGGWENLTIGSTTVSRTAALYFQSGGQTTWFWSGVSNPFGTIVGATKAIVWS